MNTAIASPEDRQAPLARMLAQAALGDRAAFRKVYEMSASHLLGVILRINRDRGQAEDLLQDVFVKIWGAAGSFDAQRALPMTWMTSIARNRAIDSLRRKQTEPALVSSHHGEDDDDPLDQVASTDAGPQELLAQALQSRVMKSCMACLSGEQQQSLALAFYDGLTHSEVATHLGQPLGTIKSWLRRGLQALRSCLEHAGTIEPSGA